MEDYRARMQDDVHESNKPLARFADDQDLDEMLRKRVHAGDPMFNFKEEEKNSSVPG